MNAKEPTWSVVAEIPAVVLRPQHLRRTICVAVVVGSSFFAMNQLGVILAGRATALVWLKAVLTYLTPLLVSNYGVLSATRRQDRRTTAPT
ncbi:MAG: nitrate/nitrite transporter NrtS [Actinomycetes bacterium]